MSIVICMRDPDSANEFHVFGPDELTIIDVDYGYLDLRNAEEFDEWRDHLLDAHRTLKDSQSHPQSAEAEAAEFLLRLIEQAEYDYGYGGDA